MRKFFYVFNEADVSKWKYCPLCGSPIIEVYPGDFCGHITCAGDDDCEIDFEIELEDVSADGGN